MHTNSSQLAPTQALIDLCNLRHNLRLLQKQAPGIEMIGVVKANAYGHGSVEVSCALIDAGLRCLAVATVAEAVVLRKAGIACRIMVFGAPRNASVRACVEYELEPFVTGADTVDLLRGVGALNVHVHIDTGMGRLGIKPGELPGILRELEGMPGIRLIGISTHFANVSDPDSRSTSRQWSRFVDALKDLGSVPAPVHVANSGALFTVPESIDPLIISQARLGIALYGLLDAPPVALEMSFRPVMTLRSEIAHVKTVESGTPISYNGLWTAPRQTRIATVAAGYADGYPRLLTNRASVGILGTRYRVVGTVCMDLFMVDLGPKSEKSTSVSPGDPVILFGEGGPTTIEIASLADTIPYEIVCGVSSRVERIYLHS